MELECAKKILEIENNHKTELFQIEANVKEEAVKICSEEIQMLSDSYKKQYDELISRNLSLEHMMKEKIANVSFFPFLSVCFFFVKGKHLICFLTV